MVIVQIRKVTYTVPQAARMLGISPKLLYDNIKAGKFPPARRIGGRVFVSKVALEKWLNNIEEAMK